MNMLRIVMLTLICISICCAFARDSYQESKPGNEKRKSEASGSYREKANKINNRKKRNEETKKRNEIEKKRTTKIRNRS